MIRKKRNKWNITKEFIIENYVNKKKSLLKISSETSIPYETLFFYKKKFGIDSFSPSFWMQGKRNSPKTEFKKSQAPWNKGTHGVVIPWNKNKHLSKIYKKNISDSTKKSMNKLEIKIKVQRTQFKKGSIPWNKGKTGVYSSKTIELIRSKRLKQIFPKKETKIELILFEILSELKLPFKKHKAIKNICQSDAFIKPNIVLFADGDYWHCNPLFYPKPKTLAQEKNFKRDLSVNSKLLKEEFIVIRLWESDLLNRREYCMNLIKSTIGGW